MSSTKHNKLGQYALLHLNILVFSFTGILSKMAANTANTEGICSIKVIFLVAAMLFNCGIYAIFWQQNLKHFEVSIAYSHRSIYNLWALIWSFLIFRETITIGNILGIMLMVGGVLVSQSDE